MKRLFKPLSVCLGIAIPILLLGLYWLMGVKNLEGGTTFTTTGIVLMSISGGIALWGYMRRKEEELSKIEFVILMGLSLVLGMGMMGVLMGWGASTVGDNQVFTAACINIAVVAIINLISCIAFS